MRRENCNICLMKRLRNILDGCSSYKAVMDDLIKEINNETENDLSKMLSLRAEVISNKESGSTSNMVTICALFFAIASFFISVVDGIVNCFNASILWSGYRIFISLLFLIGALWLLLKCKKSININDRYCYMLEAVNECIRRNIEEKK